MRFEGAHAISPHERSKGASPRETQLYFRLKPGDQQKNATSRGIVGEVDFEDVRRKASTSPVPGGVGPMAVTMLLENTLAAADRALASARVQSVGA